MSRPRVMVVAALVLAGCGSASASQLARSSQVTLDAPAAVAGALQMAPAVTAPAMTSAPTVTQMLSRAAVARPAAASPAAVEPIAPGPMVRPPCAPSSRGVACAAP